MPVVVNEIVLVRAGWNRALPEVVVEMFGNGSRFAFADGTALIVVPATGIAELADDAFLKFGNALAKSRSAAALVSHLHFTTRAFGSFNHDFDFARIVAAGFFDIDMLPGIATQNGGGCVPEIGRRNGENVDLLVFENASKISDCFGSLAVLSFGGVFRSRGEAFFVDVTNVGNFHAIEFGEIRNVRFPPAQTHDSDAEFLPRLGLGPNIRNKRSGGRGLNEVTSIWHLGMLVSSGSFGEGRRFFFFVSQ